MILTTIIIIIIISVSFSYFLVQIISFFVHRMRPLTLGCAYAIA